MTLLRVGEARFDITPAIGPSTGSAPTQPVTSFGSAAGQFDIDLAGASCSMVILGHAPEAKVIDELVTDLWLLGDFPMRYRVWAVWQDFDEHGDDRISFQGVTYERLLNRRLFGAGGLLLTNVDVGDVVWEAIDHTQSKVGGDLGITQGNTTTGITTSVDWLPGENIGSKLEEVMKAHGCFWRIDEDKAVHVYARKDTAQILEPVMWGVNVRNLQRASAGSNFANSIYGSGSADTTPLFATHPNIATDPRGLWEAAIARPEEVIQAELEDAVTGELSLRFQGLSRWNATYVTEHWVGPARIRPGDKAKLIVPRTLAGPITPPSYVRVECVSMSLQFDGDGGMEVRAVLEELGVDANLRSAVLWLDAAYSEAGEQTATNHGTGGAALDAQYGSGTGVDSGDPVLLLPYSGESYIYYPNATGNLITVPDEAALDITGDIEIVVRVALDDYSSGGAQAIVAKANTPASDINGYWFGMEGTGKMRLNVGDGTAATGDILSSVSAGLTDGVAYWLKATYDLTDGANRQVNFYTAPDQTTEPTSWTQVGVTVSGTPVSGIGTNSRNVRFMSESDGGAKAAGKFYRGIVRDGIDGTTVLDLDATTAITDSGAESLTASTGQTVTLARGTAVRKTVLVTRSMWMFGGDDWLEVADDALLDFAADESFTIMTVHRQFGTDWQPLVGKRSGATPLGYQHTSEYGLEFGDGTTGVITDDWLEVSGPLRVAFGVRDTDSDTLYSVIDGVATTPVADTTTGAIDSAEPLRFGRIGSNYAAVEGAAIAVWRRALTMDEMVEITDFYQNQ